MATHHTAIDRRSVITGRLLNPDRVVAPPSGEIASILVQARPERLASVEAAIIALAGCEIYGRDPKGKLIVVVDAPDASSLGTTLNTTRAVARRLFRFARLSRHRRKLTLAVGRIIMTAPKLDRRQVLKLEAAAMAALAGGMSPAANAANLVTERAESELKWDKAACRFCGTGCSVMVATKENRVVATHGDIKSEVNRGLNCVKGYFLSKIMYGHDRLTKPMLRKTNGKYDKNGEFTPVSWDEAFDIMAEKFKAALKKRGPSGVGMLGSGQWTIWEGYAGLKLMKAGFRSNNLDPNARHCMASAAVGFMRTFGIDEPMGCYDDIEAADAFVLWGSNMAEMHPILWTRVADRRLSAPHVRVAVLSTFEHRSFDLADIGMVFKPQTDLYLLNAIANHIVKTGRVNKDFVDRHTLFKRGQTDIGYGLRPEHPLEKKATGRAKAGDATDISYDEYVKFLADYTLEKASRDVGRAVDPARGAGRTLRRPEDQGHQFLDHGIQPAHPRRLVQQPRLQHSSADRKDLRARQQPVLADRPALGLRHGARSRHLLASAARRHGRDQQGASRQGGADLEAAGRHHSRQAGLSRGAAEPDAEGRAAQRLLGPGQQQSAGRRQCQ